MPATAIDPPADPPAGLPDGDGGVQWTRLLAPAAVVLVLAAGAASGQTATSSDAVDRPVCEASRSDCAKFGERAFEIVRARRVAAGEARTRWFGRHGAALVTAIRIRRMFAEHGGPETARRPITSSPPPPAPRAADAGPRSIRAPCLRRLPRRPRRRAPPFPA